MAFTYPPTGSSSTSGNDKVIQLITGAPEGWYAPKGVLNSANRGWYGQVNMVPISFSKDFTVSHWAFIASEWDTVGATFADNGGRAWAALYNSDATTFAPTTLFADLETQEIPGTDPAPGSDSVMCIKEISTPVTLLANQVYWIGLKKNVNDGDGGYTYGDGVEVKQVIATGAGLQSSLPLGVDQNYQYGITQGQKGGIYDDTNSGPGAWSASHSGLYPFVTWAAADMLLTQQGDNVLLRGVEA